MKCGAAVHVKDINGSYAVRFIAQCEGRFLMITHNLDYRNGYMLSDWKGVLRELIALCVPAKIIERTMVAESTATLYTSFPLTYPLSARSFADLLAAPVDEVQAQLADLAVQTDG